MGLLLRGLDGQASQALGKDIDLVTLLRINEIMHQADVEELSTKVHAGRGDQIHLPFEIITAF